MADSKSVNTVSPTLEFLHSISKLKHLDRTGWVRKGIPKPESVAGHMYRMAIMSAFVVQDPKIDANKCIRMSIVHDMGESIIGDITPYCGISEESKATMELAAISKIAEYIPGSSDEIKNLFLEYEEGKTLEAKLVKDLDRFDMVLQAYEYEQKENKPKFLQEFFDSTKEFFETSHPIIQDLLKAVHEARNNNYKF